MLRAVLDLRSPLATISNQTQLSENIAPVSTIIRERRMRFAGHCCRARHELAGDALLWVQVQRHGRTWVGRPNIIHHTSTSFALAWSCRWWCRIEMGGMRESKVRASSTRWWWWLWLPCIYFYVFFAGMFRASWWRRTPSPRIGEYMIKWKRHTWVNLSLILSILNMKLDNFFSLEKNSNFKSYQ